MTAPVPTNPPSTPAVIVEGKTPAEAYEAARFYLRRIRWLRAQGRDATWRVVDSLVQARRWRDIARAARRGER